MLSGANGQESRSEAAYRRLVAFIEQEELPPGSRLPSESDFVERLGLSRASLREALARLRAEGRAVSRRGSGTYTAEGLPAELIRLSAIDTVQDLIDWHEFRLALETEIAGFAAERRSSAQLEAIEAAQAALMERLAQEDAGLEDAAFHRAVAAASGNRKLIEAATALTTHIFRWNRMTSERGVLTRSEKREVIAVEHGDLVAAIAERRPDQARAALRRHLLNGRARLLGSLRIAG